MFPSLSFFNLKTHLLLIGFTLQANQPSSKLDFQIWILFRISWLRALFRSSCSSKLFIGSKFLIFQNHYFRIFRQFKYSTYLLLVGFMALLVLRIGRATFSGETFKVPSCIGCGSSNILLWLTRGSLCASSMLCNQARTFPPCVTVSCVGLSTSICCSFRISSRNILLPLAFLENEIPFQKRHHHKQQTLCSHFGCRNNSLLFLQDNLYINIFRFWVRVYLLVNALHMSHNPKSVDKTTLKLFISITHMASFLLPLTELYIVCELRFQQLIPKEIERSAKLIIDRTISNRVRLLLPDTPFI